MQESGYVAQAEKTRPANRQIGWVIRSSEQRFECLYHVECVFD